jgi:hypothetical protein
MPNDTFDLQACWAEIRQQAKMQAGCLQVVQALRATDIVQCFARPEFVKRRVLYRQVGRVLANDDAIIPDKTSYWYATARPLLRIS